MNTTSIPQVGEILMASNAYQVNAVNQAGVALSSVGDSHTFQYGFLEQVSALTSAGENVTGTSATRTYTIQFRYGTDGTTWSAFATWSTVNVAALVLTANNRFYLEVKVTRTGADLTGIITWTQCTFNLTRNPNATYGHGCLTDTGLQGELADLFVVAIQSKMPTTVGGAARIKVVKNWQDKQSLTGGLMPVYVYGLRHLGSRDMRIGGTLNEDLWECRFAIKTIVETKGQTTAGVSQFDYVAGVLRRLFDARSAIEESYSFTFKSVVFVDTYFWAFGLQNFTFEDRGFSIGENDQWQEFICRFTVDISRLNYGNRTI